MPIDLRSILTRVIAFLLFAAAAQFLHAQSVTVNPSAVYLSSRARSARLTLYNNGSAASEVTVSFAFGYPQSDASGNITVPITDTPPADEPSALPWLRAFPRRVALKPGEHQVVRILANPPADLPDGEYWARLVFAVRAADKSVEAPSSDSLDVALNVVSRIVTAANYRNGAVTSGVTITSAHAKRRGDRVVVDSQLDRTGNAAFLGRLRAELLDANDKVRATVAEDVAVYRNMFRRFEIEAHGITGAARVRLTITSGRDDLPSGAALPAKPISTIVTVTE